MNEDCLVFLTEWLSDFCVTIFLDGWGFGDADTWIEVATGLWVLTEGEEWPLLPLGDFRSFCLPADGFLDGDDDTATDFCPNLGLNKTNSKTNLVSMEKSKPLSVHVWPLSYYWS